MAAGGSAPEFFTSIIGATMASPLMILLWQLSSEGIGLCFDSALDVLSRPCTPRPKMTLASALSLDQPCSTSCS